jgi:hypothetical protein
MAMLQELVTEVLRTHTLTLQQERQINSWLRQGTPTLADLALLDQLTDALNCGEVQILTAASARAA